MVCVSSSIRVFFFFCLRNLVKTALIHYQRCSSHPISHPCCCLLSPETCGRSVDSLDRQYTYGPCCGRRRGIPVRCNAMVYCGGRGATPTFRAFQQYTVGKSYFSIASWSTHVDSTCSGGAVIIQAEKISVLEALLDVMRRYRRGATVQRRTTQTQWKRKLSAM